MNCEVKKDETLPAGSEQLKVGSESVSSTEDIPATDFQVNEKVSPGSKVESQSFIEIQKTNCKSPTKVVCSLFVLLFALFICSICLNDQDDGNGLVPT